MKNWTDEDESFRALSTAPLGATGSQGKGYPKERHLMESLHQQSPDLPSPLHQSTSGGWFSESKDRVSGLCSPRHKSGSTTREEETGYEGPFLSVTQLPRCRQAGSIPSGRGWKLSSLENMMCSRGTPESIYIRDWAIHQPSLSPNSKALMHNST